MLALTVIPTLLHRDHTIGTANFPLPLEAVSRAGDTGDETGNDTPSDSR
jgi:hypothetical protein